MCKTIHNNVKTVITKIFPNKNLIILESDNNTHEMRKF